MVRTSLIWAAILACGGWLQAAGSGDDRMTAAPRIPAIEALPLAGEAAGIQLDGELNESAWSKATPITGFLQRQPNEGQPATRQTDVRVAFDSVALYIGIRAEEPEGAKIRGLLTRRDDGSPSDWIRVLIDSYHDRRTAFEFAVNAAGVKQDRYWFNDNNSDRGWDAVWDVAVTKSADCWRAEFRIPFSQLRFNPASAGTFGFAVVREVAHNNEMSTWPLLARSASGFVSSFGDLTGLTLTSSQKRLELMPYAVAKAETSPVDAGNPLTKSPDPGASVGLDLKYKVGAGLTLTGTINPDFGQVEADPAVVNLSGFETFFSERRPFFVEGSGNFSFDMDCNDGDCTGLFYSRRIGRSPHRSVGAPAGGFAAQPSNTMILGAAKLTGRLGKFSIGALDAITGREDARIASGTALARSKSPVEPASNYSIVRMNREFTNHSRLGFMVTSANRALTDELRELPSSAVTGGVDSDWRLRHDRYSLSARWAGSTVRGSTDAISGLQRNYVHTFQRPDADHVEFDPLLTALGGHAGGIAFSKITGRKLRMSTNFSYKTPGFDTNDLGYLQRADDLSMSNWWQIIRDVPTKHVRSFRINFNQWAGWNFDGDRRFSGGNINAHWTLTNNWAFGSGFNVNGQRFDDRLTRGGPGGYTPAPISQWAYLESDGRRRVQSSTFVNWFRDRHGSAGWSISPGVTYRPGSAVSIDVGLNLNRNRSDAHWVTNLDAVPAPHYVFGQLDQTTVGISMRVNYTITPRLSVQTYAQPFVSAGDYSNFRELINGRAPRYADRYAAFVYAGNPDFNYHSFRTTNVVRWEYRPGSALFVVWQQGREDVTARGDFRFRRDFGDALSTPGSNVFLVKISRWLNF